MTVAEVRRPNDTTVEVSLDPEGDPLGFRPGQFVVLVFGGQGGWQRHPFSVASAPPERRLEVSIKAAGDYTRDLHATHSSTFADATRSEVPSPARPSSPARAKALTDRPGRSRRCRLALHDRPSIDPHIQFAGYQLGWLQDFTAASDVVLPLLSCGALNGSGANVSSFCKAQIDRLAAKAGAEPSAAAAGNARAGVDRAIVDQAPAVPLYTLRSVDFVSERVGDYVYSPEYGVLLDQLWVRTMTCCS
jgi:FAD binding domain-containing protein